MNPTPSFIIVYPLGGERAALELVPVLEPMGDVTLRKYGQVDPETGAGFDVALCVVTDDSSIDAAHYLQKSLDGTPTLVVDQTYGRSIPVNGFAGLTPPGPESIAQAVENLLHSDLLLPEEEITMAPRAPLSGRFDTTLSRLGELQGTAPSMLAAATRHLAHELRVERAEAWIVEGVSSKCAFDLNSPSKGSLPIRAVDEIRGCPFLTILPDLNRKSQKVLSEYLRNKHLNVVAPIRANAQLQGCIFLSLKKDQLNDQFLDDLHVAIHLLGMVLATTLKQKIDLDQITPNSVFSALKMGILIVDRNQKVTGVFGDLSPTGSQIGKGGTIADIRSSRIREMILDALDGNLYSGSWKDWQSAQQVTCSSVALPDGNVALHFQRKPLENGPVREPIEIAALFSSLPVPVKTESDGGASSAPPSGSLDAEDAAAVRRCAAAALEGKAKSMRLRLGSNGDRSQGVLFFETPTNDESHLADDLTKAVSFAIHS